MLSATYIASLYRLFLVLVLESHLHLKLTQFLIKHKLGTGMHVFLQKIYVCHGVRLCHQVVQNFWHRIVFLINLNFHLTQMIFTTFVYKILAKDPLFLMRLDGHMKAIVITKAGDTLSLLILWRKRSPRLLSIACDSHGHPRL